MRISRSLLRRIVEQELWEGLSVNGAEGLGGHGAGFEQQNQGVTRRAPGEGAAVNGGRSQSQEMDSFDQPQFGPQDENEMPWGGMQDAGGWERQVATGITGDGTDQTDEGW